MVQDSLILASGESIPYLHIGGQAEVGLYNVVKISSVTDYASLSSSDAALLDGPDPSEVPTPLPKVPKVEENPYSPDPCLLDLDINMYPALPSPQEPVQQQATVPLPHGPVLINGVYYKPVPPPHNVVVSTSSITTTPVVPPIATTSQKSQPADKPKVGLEFAMPEEPPFQKVERKSRKKSRSFSRTRLQSRSRKAEGK